MPMTQQQLETTIDGILHDTYTHSSTASSLGASSAPSLSYRKEEAIHDRIYTLNEQATEPDGLTPAEETERDYLIEQVEKISKAVARSNLPQSQVLAAMGGTGAPGSANVTVSADVLAERERIANATDAESLLEEEPPDISEGEGRGSAIIRSAYQCYLLYNIDFFSKQHKDILRAGGFPRPGSSTPSGYVPVSSGEIKSKGYWSDVLGAPRVMLAKEEDISSAMTNKLSICPGNEDFSNIQNHEYAQLAPLLKIYKIIREDGKPSQAVEMAFSNTTSTDGIANTLTMNSAIGNALEASNIKGGRMWYTVF